MHTVSFAAAFSSLGWINRVVDGGKLNHWPAGSLSGTVTFLVRRQDGKNFVALLNELVGPSSGRLVRDIDSLLHQAAGEVAERLNP